MSVALNLHREMLFRKELHFIGKGTVSTRSHLGKTDSLAAAGLKASDEHLVQIIINWVGNRRYESFVTTMSSFLNFFYLQLNQEKRLQIYVD